MSFLFALFLVAWPQQAVAWDWGVYAEADVLYHLEMFDIKVEQNNHRLGQYDESWGVPAWGLEGGVRLGPVWLRGNYSSSDGFALGERDEDLQSYWVDAYVRLARLDFMSGSFLGIKGSRFAKDVRAPDLFDYSSTHNNLVLMLTVGVMDFDLLVSEASESQKDKGFYFSFGLGVGNYENDFASLDGGTLESFRTENTLGPLFAVYGGYIYKGETLYAGGSMGADLVMTGDGYINDRAIQDLGTVINVSGVFHGTAGVRFNDHFRLGLDATWRAEKTDAAQKDELPAPDVSHALYYSFLAQGFFQVVY